VAAISIFIDPTTEGIACKCRVDLLGPIASIGINPARRQVFEQDVSDLRTEMNSMGKTAVIIRGIPGGRQENLMSLPGPPAHWSARLASKMA
jgi:hypothetical protein